jgi:hypothetical protein
MTTSCVSSVRCTRARLTELDAFRAPVQGLGHGYVINSQILLTIETQNEAGEEFDFRDGSGVLCSSGTLADQFKRVKLTLQVCNLDPTLEFFLLGAAQILDAADNVVGSQAPPANVGFDKGVCLEVWSRAWSGSQQAITPSTAPNLAYHHWVFPYAHGFAPETMTLDNGIHLFSYSGIGEESSTVTANGPYADWPDAVVTSGGISRTYAHFFDSAIPAAQCATIEVGDSNNPPPDVDGGYQGGYPEGY